MGRMLTEGRVGEKDQENNLDGEGESGKRRVVRWKVGKLERRIRRVV
jgi:hypothetical protein